MLRTLKLIVMLCFCSTRELFVLQVLWILLLYSSADTQPKPSSPQAWGQLIPKACTLFPNLRSAYSQSMHPLPIARMNTGICPFSSQKPFISSVQFSCSVVSDSLRSHESQHARTPVHHQLPDFTQIHVHRVSDAIQPSHPLSSPSPPAPNPSQHQSLFQWVNSSHEVAKVLEFQLQHHSFQRNYS